MIDRKKEVKRKKIEGKKLFLLKHKLGTLVVWYGHIDQKTKFPLHSFGLATDNIEEHNKKFPVNYKAFQNNLEKKILNAVLSYFCHYKILMRINV